MDIFDFVVEMLVLFDVNTLKSTHLTQKIAAEAS